jgi:CRISPR-associated protein Cas2
MKVSRYGSGYRLMRILVFFDLPVTKKTDRKAYSRFRKFLIRDGFDMIQFSVYARLCSCPDMTEKHIKRMRQNLPEKGSIRVMTVTDKQYSSMIIMLGEPTVREEFDKNMIEGQVMLF